MRQHVKVRPDLFLVQHSHNKTATKQKVQPAQNHLWLFDRSGSMHYSLPGLIKDLKEQARTLKKGDTVSLGWFSGEGQNNWVIKGFKISDDSDFKVLDTLLDKHVHSVGLTCFSEILKGTKQVLEDLKPFAPSFSLILFTDGYPVVSNYNREVENILKAVSDIQGEVSSALLVGYGNYYNKQLMTDMAERIGGGLIHSEDLPGFRTAMEYFLKDSRNASKKVKIELDIPYATTQTRYPAAFSVSGATINLLAQEDKVVWLTETDATTDYVYILSTVAPKNSTEVTLSQTHVVSSAEHQPLVQGVYAAAYVLCQQGKTDQAMEVLATIGDAHLIDKLTNAYTPAEYGEAEKSLSLAIQQPEFRYKDGYKPNYLPSPDAFCLLDVLDVLTTDTQAYFYPYNKDFSYRRIGVKSSSVEDAPEFKPNDEVGVPISSLVWNSSMLNLSVYAKINGAIQLTGNYEKLGFASKYPTYINRNYTLVKDGFLNVKKLPVSLSLDSFTKLKEKGVIDETQTYSQGSIYLLNLDKVPVINKAMAEGRTSATKLAEAAIKEQELKAQLKALKYFKDQELGEEKEKTGVFASLNDEQIALLESHYIGKNGFSPKTEKGESVDYYFAKEFEVKLKGLSSLPKITDVQNKMAANKKLTVADEMIKSGIELYEKSGVTLQAKSVKVAWLTSKIEEIQKEQRKVSRDIQETKFSVLLAKKWFDEFQTREENTLTHKGHTLTFALREVQVDY